MIKESPFEWTLPLFVCLIPFQSDETFDIWRIPSRQQWMEPSFIWGILFWMDGTIVRLSDSMSDGRNLRLHLWRIPSQMDVKYVRIYEVSPLEYTEPSFVYQISSRMDGNSVRISEGSHLEMTQPSFIYLKYNPQNWTEPSFVSPILSWRDVTLIHTSISEGSPLEWT